MTTMMFYEKPVTLNRECHRSLRLDSVGQGRFSFAAGTNSLLLAATEIAEACKDYPVVFVGNPNGEYTLAALVGLRDRENLFVNDNGEWLRGRYLPAFVRRYPFVLADGGGSDMTVCIDEKYAAFNEKQGDPLFDQDGKETAVLKMAIGFLQVFHNEMKRTKAFGARLAELDLLVPKIIRIERDGKADVLNGLYVVDEQKLQALKDKQVTALFRDGMMPWIYAHLLSLRNIERLGLLQHVVAQAKAA